MHETTTVLLVTLPNIHRLKKFTRRLSNEPFLIWLLTTPSHLKYVATLPCNLSLMACFADKVRPMWQHVQGAVGVSISIQLQIYQGIFQWKILIGSDFIYFLTKLWSLVCGPTFLANLETCTQYCCLRWRQKQKCKPLLQCRPILLWTGDVCHVDCLLPDMIIWSRILVRSLAAWNS